MKLNLKLPAAGLSLNEILYEVEEALVYQAFAYARGNQSRAAELLRVKRPCFIAKMKRFRIQRYQDKDPKWN